MEELREQGSSTFLEESGGVSIHQNTWGCAFQLLHLYTHRASGKILCPGKKKSRPPLSWRCFNGAACQHVLHKKAKLHPAERFRDLHQNLKNIVKSLGQPLCLCGGSLFSSHGSAYGMKVRLQFKFSFHILKIQFQSSCSFFCPNFCCQSYWIKKIGFNDFSLFSCCIRPHKWVN